MEPIFIVIVVILALLAVLDLIVGVANDAVNFMNSALGAKVAPHNVILLVSAIGIIVGVLTSSGMMEVARSGVFHPEAFTFTDVMFLFVGVMLADVVLLNTFNSLGLPTSTTVSFVFELLGASVAIALYKIWNTPELSIDNLGNFINSGKALVIISAIFVSVIVAFTFGGIIMYVSRIIFSFRYNKMFKQLGAMWCGISLTGIIYFALFKGLKNSAFVSKDFTAMVDDNIWVALTIAWICCSLLLGLMQYLKINIMKFTILAGTFALALAFAGNDLVNFIGVPIAGFDSFMSVWNGGETESMAVLRDVSTVNTWLLLIAGVIMTLTLFFSRDAMKVAETQLSLSSQHESEERFGSSIFSRNIVRLSVRLNATYNKLLPSKMREWINGRFEPLPEEERGDVAYDLIRAAVNLTAASILICLGTSLKLPLSTTYVVFMVAMATSLADRAWGRDSAVYRITGVLVVISGWFMTAIAGFTIAFVVGLCLISTEWIALIILSLLCGYALIHNMIFKAKNKKEKETLEIKADADDSEVLFTCTETVCTTMKEISDIYNHMLVALFTENRKVLRETVTQSEILYKDANKRKYEIMSTIKKLQNQKIETAHFYVQVVDYITEVTKALLHCTRPAYEHIDNNHRGFTEEQIVDLKLINDEVENIFNRVNQMLTERDFSHIDDILVMRDSLFEIIAERIKNQIRRIKAGEASTRASALYFNILNETKTMILQSRNLLKSQAHFLVNIK